MSMKKAFKALGGVWPDDGDGSDRLYKSSRHANGYFTTSFHIIDYQYIGTREEFEACRKEKWYLLTENREIPVGAKRVRLNNGHISEVICEGWYMSNDQLAYPMAYTYE